MVQNRLRNPASRLVAVLGAVLSGISLLALAAAALASGHGDLSGGVGIALICYALFILIAAWLLWRGNVLGRGPVLATALLNMVAGFTFTGSAPWFWLFVALAAATLVAAALPSTSVGLGFSAPGGRPGPDEPGR